MGYNPLLALVMPLLPSRADRTPNLLIRSYLQDLELLRSTALSPGFDVSGDVATAAQSIDINKSLPALGPVFSQTAWGLLVCSLVVEIGCNHG